MLCSETALPSLALVCCSQWTCQGSCWDHRSGLTAGTWWDAVPGAVKADVQDGLVVQERREQDGLPHGKGGWEVFGYSDVQHLLPP